MATAEELQARLDKLRARKSKAKKGGGRKKKIQSRIDAVQAKLDGLDKESVLDVANRPLDVDAEKEKREDVQKLVESEIDSGLELGEKIADKTFAEGSLGRLDESRPGEIQELLDARRAQLGGLTAKENMGLVENARGQINQQASEGTRLLQRQLRSGVRGGVLAGQAQDLTRDRLAAQRQLSGDILQRNFDARQQAITNFGDSAFRATQFDRDAQVFNLGQKAAENAGRASAIAGGISTLSGLAAGARGEISADKALEIQIKLDEERRKQQEAILARQESLIERLGKQARRDATGGF